MLCVWVRSTIMALFLASAGGAWAADVEAPEQTPHQVIESVTDQLVEEIAAHRDTFSENPESFLRRWTAFWEMSLTSIGLHTE